MTNGVTVTVSQNWDRWAAGFGHVEQELRPLAERAWDAAMDVFFERSQSYAHVLTGENKASGHYTVGFESGAVVGTLEYDSDHAIYEEMRGGEHAFIGRAWESTEILFRQAIPEAWEALVGSWR